jgi:hypothetical protein
MGRQLSMGAFSLLQLAYTNRYARAKSEMPYACLLENVVPNGSRSSENRFGRDEGKECGKKETFGTLIQEME